MADRPRAGLAFVGGPDHRARNRGHLYLRLETDDEYAHAAQKPEADRATVRGQYPLLEHMARFSTRPLARGFGVRGGCDYRRGDLSPWRYPRRKRLAPHRGV